MYFYFLHNKVFKQKTTQKFENEKINKFFETQQALFVVCYGLPLLFFF